MLVGDNATIDEGRLRNDHGPQQRSDLQRGRQEHVARALPATERNPRTTAPVFCALGGELDTVAAHLDTADFDAVRCGPDNLFFRSSTAMFGRCRIMLHNNVFQSSTRSADPAGTGTVRLFRHADYRSLCISQDLAHRRYWRAPVQRRALVAPRSAGPRPHQQEYHRVVVCL